MQNLVERLAANQAEFLEVAGHLSDDVADLSLSEDGWTVWGVLAHLAASEWQLRRVSEIIVEDPDFEFPDFELDDLNARSVTRYEGQSLTEIVEQWRQNRQKTIEFAATLDAPQREITTLHPRFGEITPEYPIERALWHTQDHLAQLRAALRRAGP